MLPPNAPLAHLWSLAGGDPAALDRVTLTGRDPVLPSSFAVGALAQASIAAAGLAAAEIHRARTGEAQTVTVDMRHAAIEFRSERHCKTDAPPADPWDKIAGLYRTRDRRWVRLHTNFPHHRDGILALLGCAYDRDTVQAKLLEWDGETFETAAAERRLVVTLMRSPAEWAAHPQGQAVAALPLIEITRIGDAPPRRWPAGDRPLSNLRVLDLTRIIAGPVAARCLAAHGADVLHVSSPNLPTIPSLVADTGRGKRPTYLDLDTAEGRDTLHALARDADVFLQGYRPGGLAARGFAPEALAKASPGIVAATLSAYGHVGPWSPRRGFDSLTQNANGINFDEAKALSVDGIVDRPKELPAQALDHGAGYLLAFAMQMALLRQRREGGSWHVRTSLAEVGEWLKSLPRVPDGPAHPDPKQNVADLLETTPSGFGPMTAVRHAAILSKTPARWSRPALPLGTCPPVWT
jgi:crotonobetainyl-CoA:carnitine CoA-transferase CaiB-like acyl-CoA transferase